jgi:hypothetical protein
MKALYSFMMSGTDYLLMWHTKRVFSHTTVMTSCPQKFTYIIKIVTASSSRKILQLSVS